MSIRKIRRIPIECAIARGMTDAEIAAKLGEPLGDVIAVRAVMDAINAEDVVTVAELQTAARTEIPVEYDDTPFDRYSCGTHAAYVRHQTYSEPVDVYCRNAERKFQRERYERRCDVAEAGAA